jgi:hypothetical protein
LAQDGSGLGSTQLGHANVANHQVGWIEGTLVEKFFPRGSGADDLMPHPLHNSNQELADVGFVIGHGNTKRRGHGG